MAMVWDGDRENDQVLDSIEVGPLKAGKHQFVFDVSFFWLVKSLIALIFQATNVPDFTKVKEEYVTDVCALFLHCAYRGQRFASVSFYVSNTYTDEELVKEPPEKPILDKVCQSLNILVLIFQIFSFNVSSQLKISASQLSQLSGTTTPILRAENKLYYIVWCEIVLFCLYEIKLVITFVFSSFLFIVWNLWFYGVLFGCILPSNFQFLCSYMLIVICANFDERFVNWWAFLSIFLNWNCTGLYHMNKLFFFESYDFVLVRFGAIWSFFLF